MNQLPINHSELSQERIVNLKENDPRFYHIQKILRLSQGDKLKIFIPDMGRFHAEIVQFQAQEISIVIKGPLPHHDPKLHFIFGLCRPIVSKKLLEYCAMIGSSKVSFIKAELSEKSYLSSQLWEPENSRPYLIKGLAQSNCYVQVPEIHTHPNLQSFIKSHPENSLNYLLSAQGKNLAQKPKVEFENINFIIGPERGWTQNEELLIEEKLKAFKLKVSVSTLKIEAALLYAASIYENYYRLEN